MNKWNKCDSCNSKVYSNFFKFSCNHNFCYICFSHSILNDFENFNSENLFKEMIICNCSICNEGNFQNTKKCIMDKLKIISCSNDLNGFKLNQNKINNLQDNKSIICVDCKKNESDFYCIECDNYICKACNIHDKVNSLKKHILITKTFNNNEKVIDNIEIKYLQYIEELKQNNDFLKKFNSKIQEFQKSILEIIEIYNISIKNADDSVNLFHLTQKICCSNTYIRSLENKILETNEDKKASMLKCKSKYKVNNSEYKINTQKINEFKDLKDATKFSMADKNEKNIDKCNNKVELEKNIQLGINSNLEEFSCLKIVQKENDQDLDYSNYLKDLISCISNLEGEIEKITKKINSNRDKFSERKSNLVSITELSLIQNIECENIHIIYKPNMFTTTNLLNSEEKESYYIIWSEKNNEIVIYDLFLSDIIGVLQGHESPITSLKSYKYDNCCYLLSTGKENFIWNLNDMSIVTKISLDFIIFAGELLTSNSKLNLIIVSNNLASPYYIYSSKSVLIKEISQSYSILAIYNWVNIFSKENYIISCGMIKDENSCGIINIQKVIINTSLNNSGENNKNTIINEDVDYELELYKTFKGSKGFFILKAEIFIVNGRFYIIFISQNGEMNLYELETEILVKRLNFFSLCDFYIWDDKSLILLGDELNNYIIFSLSTFDVSFIANKDHSYSINAQKIIKKDNKQILLILDSNNSFKIYSK